MQFQMYIPVLYVHFGESKFNRRLMHLSHFAHTSEGMQKMGEFRVIYYSASIKKFKITLHACESAKKQLVLRTNISFTLICGMNVKTVTLGGNIPHSL
jgi:hypothetical protein